jgi:hypothetical protein
MVYLLALISGYEIYFVVLALMPVESIHVRIG